jgi:hypothetical protein
VEGAKAAGGIEQLGLEDSEVEPVELRASPPAEESKRKQALGELQAEAP